MQCGGYNYSNVASSQTISQFGIYNFFAYYYDLSFVVLTKLKAILLRDFGILFTEVESIS